MISVGDVLSGSGYPSQRGGLILPFEHSGEQFRLFLPNIQMDFIAANALSNSRRAIEPTMVEVRTDEEPTHKIQPIQTLGNGGDIDTVSIFHTVEGQDFFGTAFTAHRRYGEWMTTEIREAPDEGALIDFAVEMSQKGLRSVINSATLFPKESATDLVGLTAAHQRKV